MVSKAGSFLASADTHTGFEIGGETGSQVLPSTPFALKQSEEVTEAEVTANCAANHE